MRIGRRRRKQGDSTEPSRPRIDLHAAPPVVVSLTSHPARYRYLSMTLTSLLELDYPEYIVSLHVPSVPPRRVMRMAAADERLHVEVVDRDYGPATKYLYALKRHPDRAIAVCDDDHLYAPGWLRTLVARSEEWTGEVCVACTGMVKLDTIDPELPSVRDALRSVDGVTLSGLEVYRKLRGKDLLGDPVPTLWPQGYTGYLLPPGLAERIDPTRHYEECRELHSVEQLRDMDERLNDDALMGAYLNRLGVRQVVVPHRIEPAPIVQVTRIESISTLQERFQDQHGVNMSVATYSALHARGWM